LRLAARGGTGLRALAELHNLPEEHALRARAWPVALAYKDFLMHDFQQDRDMNLYEQALVVAREIEQRYRQEGHGEGRREGRREAAQRILSRLVTRRFGTLPEGAAARIEQADTATLERWSEQVLTAQSVADVFA
jgi:hypothetical protein